MNIAYLKITAFNETDKNTLKNTFEPYGMAVEFFETDECEDYALVFNRNGSVRCHIGFLTTGVFCDSACEGYSEWATIKHLVWARTGLRDINFKEANA